MTTAPWCDSFSPPVLVQHRTLEQSGPAPFITVLRRRPAEPSIPVTTRVRWLRAIHPGATVTSGSHGAGETCRPVPGGEDVRTAHLDPVRAWGSFHPIVQGALTVRVCVVGAESTGKSTLVQALSARHRTKGVGEFGRDYTIAKKNAGTNDHWTTDDFIQIAKEQQRLEDTLAVGAGPLFFCDTDAMTTGLWHERYQGSRSPVVDRLGRMRTYDLFVLCGTDIPWERDEIRLGADTRAAMHQRFLDVLETRSEPWIIVTGSVDERMAAVDDAVGRLRLLTRELLYRPTRQHLR